MPYCYSKWSSFQTSYLEDDAFLAAPLHVGALDLKLFCDQFGKFGGNFNHFLQIGKTKINLNSNCSLM